jgi:hypothetical protein
VEREALMVHNHDYLDASPRFRFDAPQGLDEHDAALTMPVA